MAHQLDDFFKSKLDEREFEFKDAYWADAVELIEAEEDNDRKGLLYWLLAGLLLCSLVGFLGYQQWTATPSSIAQTELSSSDTPTHTNKTIVQDLPESETNKDTNTAAISSLNTPNINTNNSTTIVSKSETQKPNIKPSISTSKSVIKGTPKTVTTPASAIVLLQKEETSSLSNTTASKKDVPVQTETLAEQVPTNSQEIPSTVEQAQPNQTLPNTPDLLKNPNGLTAADLDKVFKPSPLTKPSISNPFSLGLRASSLLYMALPDGRIGYSFGLTGGYDLSRNWSIHTDLLYHVRRHQFSPIDQNQVVDYGFGRTESQQMLRASALHSFELPIYVSYSFGSAKQKGLDFSDTKRYNKHSLEIGVAPIYLYGTKGAIAQNATDGEEQILQEGWIDTAAYRKFYINGLLAYNYRLKEYFSVGIRARYAVGGIIDTSFELPQGVLTSQPDNLYFDINAKFDLF